MKRPVRRRSQLLIQRASEWLKGLGWSAAEAPSHAPDGSSQWRVDATHGAGETVSVLAATRSGAWDFACRSIRRSGLDPRTTRS